MTTKDYGTVTYDGQTLKLIQDAYDSNYGTDGVRYYAEAIDVEGNRYMVAWETTPEWDAGEYADAIDESDACDWDNPVDAARI